jgi:hypothetical protein
MPGKQAPLEKRFWAKVQKTDGCWLWLGGVNSGGYGSISRGHRQEGMVHVHRVSYEMHCGEIPQGLVIDHLCRNRACVNPAHMELVTLGENVLRGEGFSARAARKTHCLRGHEFTEENTYRPPSGGRYCRLCIQIRKREGQDG